MAKADSQDQEPVIKEIHEYLPRRRLLVAGYLILALLVAALLVLGGRALYRHSHKPVVKNLPANTKHQALSTSKTPGNGGGVPRTGNNQPAGSTSLPNSGPGQVIGLFIASSLAAAGLHFVIGFQRATKID